MSHWQIGPVQVWQCPHTPGERGEPMARQVLGPALAIAPDEVPIHRDARGRPCLIAPVTGHDAGWSHSGHHLLVALGQGVRVGVDLERIRERPKMAQVIARYFHPAEVQWLLGLDDAARQHWFFRVWCAKEAILKCHGYGIAFGLHRFAMAERDGRLIVACADPDLGPAQYWFLHEWAVDADFRAAVAWQAA